MTVKEDIINKFKLIKQLFDTQPIRRLTSDGDTYIPNQNCKISGGFYDKYCKENMELVFKDKFIKEELVMNFGEAITAIKNGKKAYRQGWNGKNQYVELATRISYVNSSGIIINIKHDAIGNNALAFVGTSGVQLGWLASQADMLAEDWAVRED